MTDYLEWKQEEKADALWEAVRQLEVQPATVTGRNPRAGGDPEAGVWIWSEDAWSEHAAVQGEQRLLRLNGQDTGTRDTEYGDETLYERARTRFFPEQNEGVNTLPDRLPAGRTRRETAQEEMGQAERLDRIFRRDGRRYDGGFFLY